MARELPLSNGEIALIDERDYEVVRNYLWHVGMTGRYVFANMSTARGRRPVPLHVFLLRPESGQEVDHENGNKLDNRRENLRVATRAQNQRNKGLQRNNTSGYKGVYRRNKRWVANLRIENRTKYLGTFDTPEEAARAYNDAAIDYSGEFAWLNPLPVL